MSSPKIIRSHHTAPPTVDYYDLGNLGYIEAWKVEAQLRNAPDELQDQCHYPSYYNNYDNEIALVAAGRGKFYPEKEGKKRAWLHFPIMIDSVTTWTPSTTATTTGEPGAVRAVWTEGNKMSFDIIYHKDGLKDGEFLLAKLCRVSPPQKKSSR